MAIYNASLITDANTIATASSGIIINLRDAADALCAKLVSIENIIKEAGITSQYELSAEIYKNVENCTSILINSKALLDQINWKALD